MARLVLNTDDQLYFFFNRGNPEEVSTLRDNYSKYRDSILAILRGIPQGMKTAQKRQGSYLPYAALFALPELVEDLLQEGYTCDSKLTYSGYDIAVMVCQGGRGMLPPPEAILNTFSVVVNHPTYPIQYQDRRLHLPAIVHSRYWDDYPQLLPEVLKVFFSALGGVENMTRKEILTTCEMIPQLSNAVARLQGLKAAGIVLAQYPSFVVDALRSKDRVELVEAIIQDPQFTLDSGAIQNILALPRASTTYRTEESMDLIQRVFQADIRNFREDVLDVITKRFGYELTSPYHTSWIHPVMDRVLAIGLPIKDSSGTKWILKKERAGE